MSSFVLNRKFSASQSPTFHILTAVIYHAKKAKRTIIQAF